MKRTPPTDAPPDIHGLAEMVEALCERFIDDYDRNRAALECIGEAVSGTLRKLGGGQKIIEDRIETSTPTPLTPEAEPDAPPRKVPRPAKDETPRGTPKPCCGSLASKHKKSCTGASAAEEPPDEDGSLPPEKPDGLKRYECLNCSYKFRDARPFEEIQEEGCVECRKHVIIEIES